MATDPITGQAIFGRYNVGLHNVGSYQVSGVPYLTGSTIGASMEHTVKFPMITKSITVIASGSNGEDITSAIQVAFNTSSAGSVTAGRHYVSLASHGSSITFNVKCKKIFIKSHGANNGYMVVAELTSIPTGSMPNSYLTGSGLTADPDDFWEEHGF